MTVDRVFAVRGLGLRLSGATEPGDLVRQLTGRVEHPGAVRPFVAPHTDLPPVDRWVPSPVDVRLPEQLPARGLRTVPYESLLALAAAAEAVSWRPAGPDPSAVLWASSTAGLAEYATICTDAALLDPGLTSPAIAPASAYNGPASTVSIRLGMTGPIETLTGGPTAGMSALVEAFRLVALGEADRAVVGASASVSRWSLAAAADGLMPAEGAVCLAVEPWRGEAGVVRLRRPRRLGLDPARLAEQLRAAVRSTGRTGPVVLSVVDGGNAGQPGADLVDALTGRPGWHVERRLGDLGAAGGLLAVTCAVAHCAAAGRPAEALAVVVEPSGNTAILEVTS